MSSRFSVPKYRNHRGSGQAFVQVKGKRYYLGRYGSAESKERYSRFIAELNAQPTDAAPIVVKGRAGLTLVELCDVYLDFAEGYYRKNGRLTSSFAEITRAVAFVCESYGRSVAAKFGPLNLMAVQEAMAARRLSRRYVNGATAIVRRIFQWAAARELVPPSVWHGLLAVTSIKANRTAAREPAPVRPVDDQVVEATLPHLPSIVADMVRFQRLTGCRPGEVVQLRLIDLDQSGEVWLYRPASHKTEHHGRGRVIFVGPKAQAVILPYLSREPTAYCFSPAESEAKRREELRARRKTKVQPSQQYRRKKHPQRVPKDSYTEDSYARAGRLGVQKANAAIRKDAELFGIENPALLARWSPNRLRHAAGTEIRRRFGLEAAQVSLGHAHASVTEIYSERDQALAEAVMKQIG